MSSQSQIVWRLSCVALGVALVLSWCCFAIFYRAERAKALSKERALSDSIQSLELQHSEAVRYCMILTGEFLQEPVGIEFRIRGAGKALPTWRENFVWACYLAGRLTHEEFDHPFSVYVRGHSMSATDYMTGSCRTFIQSMFVRGVPLDGSRARLRFALEQAGLGEEEIEELLRAWDLKFQDEPPRTIQGYLIETGMEQSK